MSNIREQYANAYRLARTGKLESAIESLIVLRDSGLIPHDARTQKILLAARSAFDQRPDATLWSGCASDHYIGDVRHNPLPDQLQSIMFDRQLVKRQKLARIAWRIRLRNNFAHGNYPFTIRPFARNYFGRG